VLRNALYGSVLQMTNDSHANAPGAPKPKKFPIWLIVVLAIIPVTIAGIGIMSVLAIYGVRKYIANAKTAEARNVLGQLAKGASAAFERNQRICPSASSPVPSSMSDIKGIKYQSTAAEWEVDTQRKAGFACLNFAMPDPQYFQYEYTATATAFTLRAHGDLNGDGKASTFEIQGQVRGQDLTIAPSIKELNPEE
jgi:type IV pilus assembly protein PilA